MALCACPSAKKLRFVCKKTWHSPSHTPVAQGDHLHFTKKSEQYRCQPVRLGNTGVCRLGCVEFTYTSASVRHIVRCPAIRARREQSEESRLVFGLGFSRGFQRANDLDC